MAKNALFSTNKPHSKSLFSKEEDQLLLKLFEVYPAQWKLISHFMPGRNPRQCHDRYTTYLDPSVSTKEWTEEEDIALFQRVKELGAKWVKISQYFPGRTDTALKNRYNTLLRRFQKGANTDFNQSYEKVLFQKVFYGTNTVQQTITEQKPRLVLPTVQLTCDLQKENPSTFDESPKSDRNQMDYNEQSETMDSFPIWESNFIDQSDFLVW